MSSQPITKNPLELFYIFFATGAEEWV